MVALAGRQATKPPPDSTKSPPYAGDSALAVSYLRAD